MLPDVVIENIISFTPTFQLADFKSTNKYFNNEYNKRLDDNASIIQKFYKSNRISETYGTDLPYFLGYEKYRRFLRLLKCNLYYRKIILWYEDRYIMDLPEQLLNKLPTTSSRHIILLDWIENNLDSDITQRKRSDIANFLRYNRITIKEMMLMGV